MAGLHCRGILVKKMSDSEEKTPIRSKGARGIRLNPQHDERARAKIKTSQIINRLNAFSLSEKDPQTDKPVEMSPTQVTAALGLLKKTLPDLSSVDISGLLNVNQMQHEEAIDELE